MLNIKYLLIILLLGFIWSPTFLVIRIASYASLGYRYGLFDNTVFLSPLMGVGYDSTWTRNHSFKRDWAGPFIGANLQFQPLRNFDVNLGYSYHVLHLGEKTVQKMPNFRISEKISSWKGQGNRAQLNMNYTFVENFEIGLMSSLLYFSKDGLVKARRRTTGEETTKDSYSKHLDNAHLLSFGATLRSTLFF